MLRGAALVAACLCAVCTWVARAASDDSPATAIAPPAAESAAIRGAIALNIALNTPAQSFVRRLPGDALKAPAPRRFASGDYINPRTPILLDEIRVYGQVEPEDYVRRKQGAMAPLRARLENDRPMTPADKVKLALCFVGLCGVYGSDGLPREPSLDERSEARINQSTTQLNNQFRGALQ